MSAPAIPPKSGAPQIPGDKPSISLAKPPIPDVKPVIPGDKPPPPKPGEEAPPVIPHKPKTPRESQEDSLQKLLKKRLKVVQEMVSTEETYLEALKMMVEGYYDKLIVAAETEALPGISKEDIKLIFSNVSHLLPIHQTLLEQLQTRLNQWNDSQCVGDILLKMAPFFRLYNNFQNSYEKAQVVLTRCEANELFHQMIENIDKELKTKVKDKAATKLENLLIQVIQRIPRWILLLNECASKTPEGHADIPLLKDAAAQIERVMNYLNEDITSSEYRERFLAMRSKVKGVDNLIKAHRVLIAEGTLNLKSKHVTQTGGGLKSKFNRVTKDAKLQIWLFNDVIVSLKSSKSKKRTNVSSTEYTWPLQLVWLKDNEELDPSDPKMPHTFMLVGPRKSYTLRFSDVLEKREWYNKIKETVNKQLNEEIAPDDVKRFGTYKFPDKHGPEYEGWWNTGRIHGHGTFKVFGNTYIGEWEYNRKHGTGSFHSVTGAEYHGQWKDDRPHGMGDLLYAEGDRYEGLWMDGLQHGKGTLFFANGDRYIGNWAHGVPSGCGSFSSTTGIVYGGDWSVGKPHGYGCLVMPNGRRYEGEFVNGLKHGEGKLDYNNGDFYIGQWQRDKPHGYGILHCAIEGIYEGMFVDGLKEGPGKMRFANGDYYEGGWKKGLFHDKGKLICPVGAIEKYEGQFEHGKFSGKGLLTYRNGSKYEGPFKDDKPHGYGTFTSANSVIFDGKFVDGRREGKASIAVGPVNYSSACLNGMMGKREASFIVVPDVPAIHLEL